jgi:2',3'-cyclic-nucleotide 2'-phosphodiesterase (5'-nucleotidase family)
LHAVRLTILHTNDIHGHEERIAQIATLVREEKAGAQHLVLYLDAGDVEETTNHLSNVTKGAAMHRLLGLTTCDAATVGNACWLRYGPGVLAEHARVSSYPQLLANFSPVVGPVPSVLLGGVGVFGLTDPFRDSFTSTDWGFEALDEVEVAKAIARHLRAQGAELVVLLSHLGLSTPRARWDDRRIAAELQDDVDLIVGAHSHDLLPAGEWVGRVLIVQAGKFGEHLGRVEIDGDTMTASVEPVGADVPQYPGVAAEAQRIGADVATMLAEPIGRIDVPLDARWIAEMLRERMGADAGIFSEGQTLGVLPPGTVLRGALWEVSESAANPGVTEMSGAQLRAIVERGNDPSFMAETPRPFRGRTRGRLWLAGLEAESIEPERRYAVAGSDWELDFYGGYAERDWGLSIRYDFPVIIREAVEEHLARR